MPEVRGFETGAERPPQPADMRVSKPGEVETA